MYSVCVKLYIQNNKMYLWDVLNDKKTWVQKTTFIIGALALYCYESDIII